MYYHGMQLVRNITVTLACLNTHACGTHVRVYLKKKKRTKGVHKVRLSGVGLFILLVEKKTKNERLRKNITNNALGF